MRDLPAPAVIKSAPPIYHICDMLSTKHNSGLTYILHVGYNRQESSPAKLPSQLLWNHPGRLRPTAKPTLESRMFTRRITWNETVDSAPNLTPKLVGEMN